MTDELMTIRLNREQFLALRNETCLMDAPPTGTSLRALFAADFIPDHPAGLSFNILRAANMTRLPLFKNGKGEKAHSEPDGSDWSLNDWLTAVCGELGEAANILKKVRRGDFSLAEEKESLAKEFADVQIYLDILAFQAGIDLGAATVQKFNEVSDRIGAPVHI